MRIQNILKTAVASVADCLMQTAALSNQGIPLFSPNTIRALESTKFIRKTVHAGPVHIKHYTARVRLLGKRPGFLLRGEEREEAIKQAALEGHFIVQRAATLPKQCVKQVLQEMRDKEVVEHAEETKKKERLKRKNQRRRQQQQQKKKLKKTEQTVASFSSTTAIVV